MKTKTLKSVSHLSEIQALKRSDIIVSYIVTDTLFCILSYFLQSIKRMSVNVYIGGLKRQI